MEGTDGRRRGREDYEELNRLLEEADRSLADGGELREANEALKKAGVKAASMWGEVGPAGAAVAHEEVDALIGAVQRGLHRPEQSSADTLRRELRQLRSRFEIEARRDAGQTALQNGEQMLDGRT